MRKALVFLIFALASLGANAAQSMCTSNVTKELEACARANFEYSDRILNSAYADLATKLSASDKGVLVRAEREWLTYKNATCQGAYDATSPGEEAGIDKWTCLDQITRARTDEIQLLNTGIGALGYYKALDIVPKIYEAGAREKFVSKLVDIYSKSDDKNWRSYVDDNCKLSASRVRDEKAECIARQVFYRY
ncbi:lysozyme inhibitor LprI family protein [Burkholderia ubonensis]|uniref:lysozyme inhibitor LprI family protein n=1 Tax=Burkholderia ubonensis TaxID=101571 RepID=UPI0009B4E21E|nr:lysozyme inhibitor LprI family protein [Burkholderia ubonensis]